MEPICFGTNTFGEGVYQTGHHVRVTVGCHFAFPTRYEGQSHFVCVVAVEATTLSLRSPGSVAATVALLGLRC